MLGLHSWRRPTRSGSPFAQAHRDRSRSRSRDRHASCANDLALDTTVAHVNGADDAFFVTGDVAALWLRDSANQAQLAEPTAVTVSAPLAAADWASPV